MPFRESTLVTKTLRNATISLAEYRWHAGDEFTWSDRSHFVTWRLYPATVSYGARSETSELTYGRLSFFPANIDVHTSAARVDQCGRSITCRFAPSWFSAVSETDRAFAAPDLARLLDIDAAGVNQLVQRIGAEILNPGTAGDRLLDALCTSLAIELARYIDETPRSRVRTSNALLNKRDLQDIVEHIENNIDNPEKCLGTAELCKAFHVSPTHLRRAFKNTTGETLQAFVTDLRLAKAKSLLAGREPIKSIAFRLGFKEASAFSYAFKLKCGMTASAYRSMLRS